MTLVTVNGPYSTGYQGSAHTTASGATGSETGKGIVIGDGFVLTAGHVVFEWDRVSGSTPNIIYGSAYNGKIYDYRGYQAAYAAAVIADVNAQAPQPPRENTKIEGTIGLKDSVVLTGQTVTATSSTEGLVCFLNPGDMLGPALAGALGDTGASVKRLAQTTQTGQITYASGGALHFSAVSVPGDSGGAYVLTSNGKSFVIGTHAGNLNTEGFGTYFSYTEWSNLNAVILASAVGDLTTTDPTNLLVGTSGNDTAMIGTLRADILLGKDSADILDGGDNASAAWGRDQIFGGLGDDTIRAGFGADLFHGGDRKLTAGASNVSADGVDTVDYSAITATDALKGIRISLTTNPVSTIYSASVDYAKASWVTDLGRKADVDTLISIETIKATSADDILTIKAFDTSRIADTSGHGGVARIEMLGQINGDVIDLSGLNEAATVNLSLANPTISSTASPSTKSIVVVGAEQIIGTVYDDKITGSSGNDVISAYSGNDIINGGDGNDIIFNLGTGDGLFDGGAGNDKFVVKSGTISLGTGSDSVYIQKLTDSQYGSTTISGSGSDDRVYWNGHAVTGTTTGFGYIDDGSVGWWDSHGIVYFQNPYKLPDLEIWFPYNGAIGGSISNASLVIKNFHNGDLGINLPNWDYNKDKTSWTSEEIAGWTLSNIFNDGLDNNFADLTGAYDALAVAGPNTSPLPPTSSGPGTQAMMAFTRGSGVESSNEQQLLDAMNYTIRSGSEFSYM